MNEQAADTIITDSTATSSTVANSGAATDVLVVGGGLAGLTAAVTAAKAGAEVTLVDAHPLGGRAKSASRDGFTLNEGGHALYNSLGRGALEQLGVVIHGSRPDAGAYQVVWDGEHRSLPVSPKDLMTTKLLGPRSKAKLTAIFASISRSLPEDSVSVDEWLDGRRAGNDLRKYLIAVLRLGSYSADPGSQPAGMMFRQMLAGQSGVTYLDGGWQDLVDQLRELAIGSGVKIVEKAPVRIAQRSGSGWTVHTDEASWGAASVIIAAGGPAQATGILGSDAADWVERAGEPQRAACLDIGTSASGPSFLLSADQPLYLSLHSPVADLAPEGTRLYSLMRYLDGEHDRSAERNRAELDQHAADAGLPGSADRTLERFLAAPVVTWGRPVVGLSRPTGLERSADGVFAAGDWMGPQLLADASILSGSAAGISAAAHAVARR